jgi:hypothetical protein
MISIGCNRGRRLSAILPTVGRMVPNIHIVFDCADPDRLAHFWKDMSVFLVQLLHTGPRCDVARRCRPAEMDDG